MKNYVFVLSLVLLFSCIAKSQERMHHNSDAFKKVEELEKIKIIETLGLDEKTTLRFFARRNEYRTGQRKLMRNASDILNHMDELVKKDTNKNNPEYKKLINKYLSVESKMVQKRTDFINSLHDILTYPQICKLLIFEKKFREEIRQVLFRERGKWRK